MVEGDYSYASGLAAGATLLDMPVRPTAVFASNDDMAAGVMQVARQRGLELPAALSVIGFDDMGVAAYMWPPLTTVRRPINAMARAAADRLIRGAHDTGEASGDAELFRSTLIVRGSVAPPICQATVADDGVSAISI